MIGIVLFSVLLLLFCFFSVDQNVFEFFKVFQENGGLTWNTRRLGWELINCTGLILETAVFSVKRKALFFFKNIIDLNIFTLKLYSDL